MASASSLCFYTVDTERKMLRKDGRVGSKLWRFEGSSDPNTPGIDGKNSYPKANVSLEVIWGMFEAYKEIPKFAYLNAMAAHVYDQYTKVSSLREAKGSHSAATCSLLINVAQILCFQDDTCR